MGRCKRLFTPRRNIPREDASHSFSMTKRRYPLEDASMPAAFLAGRTAASAVEGLAYDKEETPYIQSVEDPGAALPDNPNTSWETYFSMAEVADAVEQVTGTRRESFNKVTIAEQGQSGRVMQYQFDDLTVGAAALRLALGGETMKSNVVEEIDIRDGQLMVKGRGYGHGVGMSQWGARALAEQGKSAAEIVQYFFKDVEIEQAGQST